MPTCSNMFRLYNSARALRYGLVPQLFVPTKFCSSETKVVLRPFCCNVAHHKTENEFIVIKVFILVYTCIT